jgi:hypothetical protein
MRPSTGTVFDAAAHFTKRLDQNPGKKIFILDKIKILESKFP